MREPLQFGRRRRLAQAQRRQCRLGLGARLLAAERVFARRRQIAFRVAQLGREMLRLGRRPAAI